MTQRMVDWACDQTVGNATAKAVLIYLAHRADADGACWPSQGTIAQVCELSARAVFSALKLLAENGLITRSKRSSGAGRTSDLITLNLANGAGQPAGGAISYLQEVREPPAGGARPSRTTCENPLQEVREPPAGGANEYPRESSTYRLQPGESDTPARAPPDLGILAAQIFDAGTDRHRERCRNDPGKIRFALRDAAAEGHDPVVVAEATLAWITSGDQQKENGRWAAPPNRFIDDGLWKNWIGRTSGAPPSRATATPAMPAPPTVTEIVFEGVTYAIPPGGTDDPIGTYELPGVRRQLSWMEQWNKRMHGWGDPRWGPPPGHPDCKIWPSVLARFRHEVWTPPAKRSA